MPQTTKTLAAGLLASASLMAGATDDNPLIAEQWRTRPLVVVAPKADHPLLTGLQAQLKQHELREAFVERELLLFTVIGDEGRRDGVLMTGGQTRSLKRALDISANAAAMVLLVGKDGGVKLIERETPLSLEAVFALIDTMPMRQR